MTLSTILVLIIFLLFFFLLFHTYMPQIQVSLSEHEVSEHRRDQNLMVQENGSNPSKTSEIDWNQYFPKICDDSPQDYPRKVIGSCPYSKPDSKPIPFSDVPMCALTS
jgi:hypothetical protein